MNPDFETTIHIRHFTRDDVPQLPPLMKELAIFEDYIDDFKVTEENIIKLVLSEKPIFKSLVVVDDKEMLGYCDYYSIAFTYNLKPHVILKELYGIKKVPEENRSIAYL